jgi:hypothetical protein
VFKKVEGEIIQLNENRKNGDLETGRKGGKEERKLDSMGKIGNEGWV